MYRFEPYVNVRKNMNSLSMPVIEVLQNDAVFVVDAAFGVNRGERVKAYGVTAKRAGASGMNIP